MLWAVILLAGLAAAVAAQLVSSRRHARALSAELAMHRGKSGDDSLRRQAALQAVLAALPDAVVWIEPDGTVAAANEQAKRLFAAQPAPARSIEDLPITARAMALVREALAGRSPPVLRVDFQQALPVTVNGRSRRLLPRIVPIGPFGAVVVLSDVTEFALLDSMRVDLVAVASHEFRTPLTTMRMALLMLKERDAHLDPREQDLLATALLGVEQLAETMDEFLDLTRIEAGQLRLTWDSVHVPSLLEQVVRRLRKQTQDAGLELKLECDARTPEVVWADPGRLRVVLTNLLGNAIKYTPRGGSIALRSSRQNAGSGVGAQLRLAVTDTGPGIPAEFRDRIFDRFFRVEFAREAADGARSGSGIGLYLCRQIVEAHGGSILADAGDAGVGTTIAVLLPAAPRETAPPRP
jgi:NtrC-family two-component system sensor histidine kinase KinB